MKQLIKIKSSELSFKLNLNYNGVYSRLKMLLGNKSSLFADVSIKSSTIWFADDNAEYMRLSDAPKAEANAISNALSANVTAVRKEMEGDNELKEYAEDILEIPDESFVFYRKTSEGYKLVLAGWGCRYAHLSSSDTSGSFIKRISKNVSEDPIVKPEEPIIKPEEPIVSPIIEDPSVIINPIASDDIIDKPKPLEPNKKDVNKGAKKEPSEIIEKNDPKDELKKQSVNVRVLDQKGKPVNGELVLVRSSLGDVSKMTSENGIIKAGDIPYGESFSVKFPNIQGNVERNFEVVPGVDTYDAHIKKFIKYSPVLFIEDQNGSSIQDYNIKVIINGQETALQSGQDGVVQLPTMLEGQKFIIIDAANYANTEEYIVTQEKAQKPYYFHVKRAEQTKVGITVLDKSGKPIKDATVNLEISNTPCQAFTEENGRAEFPSNLFSEGDIPTTLNVKGHGIIRSTLKYTPEVSEYTIQLRNRRKGGNFDWKWLLLIPLLLLLGWGGYELYKKMIQPGIPTIAEMESGVVMTLSATSYWVDLNIENVSIGKKPLDKFYFTYNPNENAIGDGTFDPDERKWGLSTGTGFLISKDGLIATNRHIADPIPPEEEVVKLLRKYFQDKKSSNQQICDAINDELNGNKRLTKDERALLKEQLNHYREQVSIFDKILNTGDFKVGKPDCKVSVAFTGSRVQLKDQSDLNDFIKTSLRKSGNPGGATEKDVAIIQINNKNEIPASAYIFSVPENDLLDGNISDDYEITVLGYNQGLGLQNMELQESIKPQAQHGKITNTSEQYRVGYDAPTLGGSSGSPVLNDKHQLIAVNNSGIGNTQGFNYGVRTKYLRELLNEINKNSNNK